MGLFKKNKGEKKPRGLGRNSTPPVESDTDVIAGFDVAEDDFDDSHADKISVHDEVMEYENMDRDEIDEELGLKKAKPKKRGLFGGKDKKAAAPKEKSKAKPKGKSARAEEKARKEREAEKELSTRLSVLVEIEELHGVTKEDAIDAVRAWALSHSDRPANTYFYVLKTRNGYLIEMQEGVGRSYLPSAHKLASENPGRIVVIPMVRRKMTMVYSPRTDSFETSILGEDVEPTRINDEEPLVAVRGPAMTPTFKQYHQWLVSGAVTAAIGGVALILSIGFYAFDPKSKVPPDWRTTNVAQLPVMQWNQLAGGSSDSYVVRLEYTDGAWRVVRQTTFAQVEVNQVDGELSSGQVIGDNVQGPNQPDVVPTGAPQPLPQPSSIPSSPQLPAGMTQP